MTISFPLTFPVLPGPSRIEWRAKNVSIPSSSPFTLVSQILEHEGCGWQVAVSYDPLTREEAAPLMAALTSLRGNYGTFYFGDTLLATPRGTAAGVPKIKGANQTGFTVITDGWTPSSAVLKAADMIQIDGSMYQILSDVIADSGGEATLDIWPRLRTHADNANIVTTAPKCLMRLVDSDCSPISAPQTQLFDISFQAEEAR